MGLPDRLKKTPLVATIVATALVCSATACIFDQGKYKGGGRLDTAGTADQKNASSSTGGILDDDDDDTQGTSSGSTTSGGSTTGGLVDAGGDGA